MTASKTMTSEVANQISVFRAKHKMSQTDLARAIGVSRKTISTIETTRYTPAVTIALKLAFYFKVPVEDIFTLTGEEYQLTSD
jgi:putative transcriptional regulator